MAMDKWVKRKWLRALKSGEYKKGKNSLGIVGQEYCCLGVLACEMVPELAVTEEYPDKVVVGGRSQFLPDDLAILWGLDESTQRGLARLNDDSDTFDLVIAYIENNL